MSSPGAPPPVLRTAVAAPAETPEPRHLEVWICLIFLIVLVFALSLIPEKKTGPQPPDISASQSALKIITFTHSIGIGDNSGPLESSSLGDLMTKRATDPVAAEFYAADQTLHGRPLGPADLAVLRKSNDLVDRDVAELYGRPHLTPQNVSLFSRNLGQRGYLGQLIRAQAYAKAGDPRPMHELEAGVRGGLFLLFGTFGFLLVASPIAWLVVLVVWKGGLLQPLGFPAPLRSLADADRFAMRGAQLVLLFLSLQIVAAVVALGFADKETAMQFSLGILMLAGVPILFRSSLYRKIVSLPSVGVRPQQLGKMVGIGLLGFVLEFPIAMSLAGLGDTLFGRFHKASHPVATQLMGAHTGAYVWSALFFASVAAPFWEEILFRGLLFPALSKVFKSAILGAAVSSFVFGAIHPQGLPLWLSLMSMACMSCALTYHTKSLVPSMVMHALHNGMALLLILALT